MKQLFLAASVDGVAGDIGRKLQAQKKHQKLVFITTASEPEKGDLWWLRADRQALVKAGFAVTDYSVTNKVPNEIEQELNKAEVICVSGGNTFYLLEKMQTSGADKIVTQQVLAGKPYVGSSAGSVVVGPNIGMANSDDRLAAPNLKSDQGLGIVDFIIFPHWGSEIFRDDYLSRARELVYSEEYKLLPLTNYQCVWVRDEWYQIVEVKHK